jgi:hypothetical protein
MARRKAQTYCVRDPFGTTAGASRRANRGRLRHRALLFPLEGRIELRLKLGQLAPSRTSKWVRREPRHRPRAHVASMSPQAPHLVPLHQRLMMRPSTGRGEDTILEVWSAGITDPPSPNSCHARPCAGHPRFEESATVEIVDGRARPGHDTVFVREESTSPARFAVGASTSWNGPRCRGPWRACGVAPWSGPPLRERLRAALRPRAVLRVAFLPPMARLDSRRPRAPTCDLPSRSCWPVSPLASLRLFLARLRLFCFLLAYFDAADSLSAMAIA